MSKPTNKKYTFRTIQEINNAMTDEAMVNRFVKDFEMYLLTNLDLTKLLKGVGFDTKPPMFEVNRDVLENMVWQDDGEIKMVIEVDV